MDCSESIVTTSSLLLLVATVVKFLVCAAPMGAMDNRDELMYLCHPSLLASTMRTVFIGDFAYGRHLVCAGTHRPISTSGSNKTFKSKCGKVRLTSNVAGYDLRCLVMSPVLKDWFPIQTTRHLWCELSLFFSVHHHHFQCGRRMRGTGP